METEKKAKRVKDIFDLEGLSVLEKLDCIYKYLTSATLSQISQILGNMDFSTGRYAAALAHLCRENNIPCKIVYGLTKHITHFLPGSVILSVLFFIITTSGITRATDHDFENDLRVQTHRDSWNIVHMDGHPFIIGFSRNTVKMLSKFRFRCRTWPSIRC